MIYPVARSTKATQTAHVLIGNLQVLLKSYEIAKVDTPKHNRHLRDYVDMQEIEEFQKIFPKFQEFPMRAMVDSTHTKCLLKPKFAQVVYIYFTLHTGRFSLVPDS